MNAIDNLALLIIKFSVSVIVFSVPVNSNIIYILYLIYKPNAIIKHSNCLRDFLIKEMPVKIKKAELSKAAYKWIIF